MLSRKGFAIGIGSMPLVACGPTQSLIAQRASGGGAQNSFALSKITYQASDSSVNVVTRTTAGREITALKICSGGEGALSYSIPGLASRTYPTKLVGDFGDFTSARNPDGSFTSILTNGETTTVSTDLQSGLMRVTRGGRTGLYGAEAASIAHRALSFTDRRAQLSSERSAQALSPCDAGYDNAPCVDGSGTTVIGVSRAFSSGGGGWGFGGAAGVVDSSGVTSSGYRPTYNQFLSMQQEFIRTYQCLFVNDGANLSGLVGNLLPVISIIANAAAKASGGEFTVAELAGWSITDLVSLALGTLAALSVFEILAILILAFGAAQIINAMADCLVS